MGKHVILLGAGASAGSGFPVANDLRLLLCSPKHLRDVLVAYEQRHSIKEARIQTMAQQFMERVSTSIELLRKGGFGSIDEFCKLAGSHVKASQIHELRSAVRAILGIISPEDRFHNSPYYSFVQALFRQETLVDLRDDVSILSYNYDSHLDFVLSSALRHRWKASGRSENLNILNAVTSGLHEPRERSWLDEDKREPRFCLLKLHGSIGLPLHPSDPGSFTVLFETDALNRGLFLFGPSALGFVPPIFFPWEIIGKEGASERQRFPIQDNDEADYFQLFRGIWERARREVQAATKISFVGLSMHTYLDEGLRHLLEGRNERAHFVSASLGNVPYDHENKLTHWENNPLTPVARLKKLCSHIQIQTRGFLPGFSTKLVDGEITVRREFLDFIQHEL